MNGMIPTGGSFPGERIRPPTMSGFQRSCCSRQGWKRSEDTTRGLWTAFRIYSLSPKQRKMNVSNCGRGWVTTAESEICRRQPGKLCPHTEERCPEQPRNSESFPGSGLIHPRRSHPLPTERRFRLWMAICCGFFRVWLSMRKKSAHRQQPQRHMVFFLT